MLPIIASSPPSLELKEEVVPFVVEEAIPDALEDPFPTVVVAGVLGNLEPKDEVVESSETGEEEEEGCSTLLIKHVNKVGDQENEE